MQTLPVTVSVAALVAAGATLCACAPRVVEVVRRYPAPEATQGVAVDEAHVYAIDSTRIGQYDKRSGRRLRLWVAPPHAPVKHLNGGIVRDGRLICAHSNYPATPMISSLELFDAATLEHVERRPLPDRYGSATWVDFRQGSWWVTFAHYAGAGGVPGQGPERTTLVRFSAEWEPQETWMFPPDVIRRWDGMSSSGGAWDDEGRLWTTGHHAPELYVLTLPRSGRVLTLHAIVPVESRGQGIAIDRAEHLLYTIQRDSREILVSRLPPMD